MKRGPIDAIIDQWSEERPDLDSSPLGVMARITRLARLIDERANGVLGQFGIADWEYQLLATLRRSGPEYQLAPRDLLEPLMLSSGGLTNRVDQLEKAGLVQRRPDPSDRRGIRIQLTESGHELANRVVIAYFEDQNRLLSAALTPDERTTLGELLKKLLISLTTP